MISIIIPVYNSEKHIGKCIRSIMAQTYHDFELIIVNDGCTDKTVDIIRALTCSFPVKIISKKNEGLPQARKTGYLNSQGEYIVFIDSDDWIEPDYLDIMYHEILLHKADIVCCNAWQEDIHGKILKKIQVSNYLYCDSTISIKEILDITGVFPYMWNKMFKRKCLSEAVFPKEHFVGEDFCTLMSILQKDIYLVHIPYFLYHYVQHNNNMTQNGFGKLMSISYYQYEKMRVELKMKYSYFDKSIETYFMLQEIAIIHSMIRNNNFDYDIYKKIHLFIHRNFIYYLFSKASITYKAGILIFGLIPKFYKTLYLLNMKHKKT